MTDSLYKGTGGHNYIQDEDSFVNKMQEEVRKKEITITMDDESAHSIMNTPHFIHPRLVMKGESIDNIDTITTQIIKNTCDEILKHVKKQYRDHDDGGVWCSECAHNEALEEVEDILTSITNTTEV